MRRWLLFRYYAHAHQWRYMLPYEALAIFLIIVFVVVMPTSALRFAERGLFMQSTEPGKTTSYTVSFRYMSPEQVGSVDMLFCIDPIPHHECVTPPGLDVSNAVLSSQSGEIGFALDVRAPNHIVLSRAPSMVSSAGISSYTFGNIINPVDTEQSFSIRLRSHASTDATGPLIDFGSVKGQVTDGVVIETQVPPMLIFCVAEEVMDQCLGTNNNYYTDMGDLSPDSTLTAQSQMAVGTNASSGFAITVNGGSMAAGTSVIDAAEVPTESRPGENQFGINLVENTAPAVGSNPEGAWTNAVPTDDYGTPDRYKFVSGDVVAYSPSVSLMKKFTVSYIVNSRDDLKPGVYSTTVTFIASGRF